MQKLSLIILFLAAACQPIMTTTIKNKPKFNPPKTSVIELTPMQIEVIPEGPLYCFDSTSFKSFSMNTEKIKLYMQEQNNIIAAYKEYYNTDNN